MRITKEFVETNDSSSLNLGRAKILQFRQVPREPQNTTFFLYRNN